MKISNIGRNMVNPYKRQQNQLEEVKQTTSKKADQLEISKAAKDLQGVSTFSSDRAERLQRIKNDIDAGNYVVDSKRLAKDILNYYKIK